MFNLDQNYCFSPQFLSQLVMLVAEDSPRRVLRPALVFLSGDLFAVSVPLERETVVLGSWVEADVRINDRQVSRRHAEINTVFNKEKDVTEYLLTDLNSKTGTFLNGQRVSTQPLRAGDKIVIGNRILRFELFDEIDHEYHMQIQRLLSHDDLTGLLTSRSFFSELKRETERAGRESRSFCVLMMDVDHFKNVNDTYGHLTGSKTLEEIGMTIKQNLRNGDVAARFGGEEFAAFILDVSHEQAMAMAEKIRLSIEKTNFSILKKGFNEENHSITISIGIAMFQEDSADPIELVEMADTALYRAKREGRNCTFAYKDLPPDETHISFDSRRK